ncbi:hypothetical protein DYB32_001497 [Aphanomyces invadans]|uniref:tRNase Z endonuclease domain-containing protein n=1 Tax=Aphanomyces invadans TaxID=157072 RepID=A0A3R6VG22_9STRA|nr:hypothetical protein DYB32_001497 [Aphanomyces invadans]
MATGAMSATARRLRHLRLTSVPKAHAEKMSLPMGELPQFTGFEIVLLGTGAGMPSTQRSASSLCVQLPAKSWLFDCGEGTLRQIFRSTVRVTTTEKIFLTHVHGDHLFGLPGMLCTLNALNAGNIDPSTKQVVRRPIDVYGPPGVFDFVNMALTVSCAHLGNVSITVHELVPCDFDSPPPYVVEEKPRPGRIDVAAATRRGLPPGRLYKLLKAGESVHLPDGTVLHPDEALQRGHSTSAMAGYFARHMNPTLLVLTHISHRFSPRHTDPSSVQQLVDEARVTFRKRAVVDGFDLMRIPIPLPSTTEMSRSSSC